MSAAVRPIHLPGAAALDSLHQHAQAALTGWAREWLAGWADDRQGLIMLDVGPARGAGDPLDTHIYEPMRAEAGGIWFRHRAADRAAFCRAVVGADLMPGPTCSDDWLAEVTDRAWDTCARALCSALLGAPTSAAPATSAALPPDLFLFGSGAVQLSCEVLGLHAIADNGVWRSTPPRERAAQRRSALVSLDRAAHRSRVRLDVMLGSVEVELPKLLDLHCGDVLRLPQRLDQGIAVLCEGKPLARAVLGETQGRKCVQVIANAAIHSH